LLASRNIFIATVAAHATNTACADIICRHASLSSSNYFAANDTSKAVVTAIFAYIAVSAEIPHATDTATYQQATNFLVQSSLL
jgi:hypothetical protein